MDLGQAFSMRHVGAIVGATVIEESTTDGSVWFIEFICGAPLPPHLSRWLETSRGGRKSFKGVQSALNDIKNIGITNATVQFASPFTPHASMFITKAGQRVLSDDGQPIKSMKSSPIDLMQADVAALIWQYCPAMHDDKIDQIVSVLTLCKIGSPNEEIFDKFIEWVSLYKRGTASFADEALLKPGDPSFFIKD